VGALKKAIYHGQSSAAASTIELQRMHTLADTIKPAFHARDDSPFMQAAAQLQHALTNADAAPRDSCSQLRAALSPITDACQSCHRKFR
ncbi:MAG: cytochrome c, partial [Xanthomonadales bacterium]|nr:cytochrome c [Xanthomonadales bacterium]